MTAPNLNTLWARSLMKALHAAGVRDVCVTPGSRSTPLTVATHDHADLKAWVHLDERSSAFFALGLAKATRRPVALVCTSGTAAANYLPAIIEAAMAGVPLIAVTADRPMGLRGSGAAQTMDQVHLYGHYARTYFEAPLPEPSISGFRRMMAGVTHACHLAIAETGPVQLNIPFADPLAPVPQDVEAIALLEAALADWELVVSQSGPRADSLTAVALADRIASAERGLIVLGPEADPELPVLELAARTGFPVLADIASGYRFKTAHEGLVCAHFEAFLRSPAMQEAGPDLVIRLGGLPTSATLNSCLTKWTCETVLIQRDLKRRDPEALVTWLIQADPVGLLKQVCDRLPSRTAASWLERFAIAERTSRELLSTADTSAIEPRSVRMAIEAMPEGSAVFLSSSMPIRYAESFCAAQERDLRVFVSRGVNGIDGITSTALGVAVGTQRPTLLITGDVALIHDLGGLFGTCHLDVPFLILALNNDGGGIFSHLPISQFNHVFEPYFGTPHGLTFEKAAEMFGLEHQLVDTPLKLPAIIRSASRRPGATLIEVPSHRETEAQSYQGMMKQVVAAVDQALMPQGACP